MEIIFAVLCVINTLEPIWMKTGGGGGARVFGKWAVNAGPRCRKTEVSSHSFRDHPSTSSYPILSYPIHLETL